jgi:hypothetical protein
MVVLPGDRKAPYPGDLWGVDEDGDLIVVETKLGRYATDPFKDFLEFDTYITNSEKGSLLRGELTLSRPRVSFHVLVTTLCLPVAADVHRAIIADAEDR